MNKLLIIYFILMILAGLFDYSIAYELYNPENVISILIEAYGQLVPCILLAGSGILLYKINHRIKGILLIISAILILTIVPLYYLDNYAPFISLLVALVTIIVSNIFILKISNKASKQEIIKWVILVLISIISVNLIVSIIKVIWQRPRMRLIMLNDEVVFKSFWQITYQDIGSYLQRGIDVDYFKSFPSGHSANAALILLLLFLNNKRLIKFLCLIVILIVPFSRMILGAHFLSDVVTGVMITIVVINIVKRIIQHVKVN